MANLDRPAQGRLWRDAVDRCIAAALAYEDAVRRLEVWREHARIYALPSGVAEERIHESEQLVARRALEAMLAEALEQGLRPKLGQLERNR